MSFSCPACGSHRLESFYRANGVPANSCVLLDSREEAIAFPRGNIDLVICDDCGFIANRDFDEALIEYSLRYEGTQAASNTFNDFQRSLAQRLIETHDLHRKVILEIGCGRGEFLRLLCAMGGNRGVGFDPCHKADAPLPTSDSSVEWHCALFNADVPRFKVDLVCCKMTLEHIPQVAEFIRMIARWARGMDETVFFFEVPETALTLRNFAFWEVYYEHCSYFTRESLTSLFGRCGFRVLNTRTDYYDQYLAIEAVLASPRLDSEPSPPPVGRSDSLASAFGRTVDEVCRSWHDKITDLARAGKRVVIWGGGSKATGFLSTLHLGPEIGCVVDINPRRDGKFVPGTGHPIVGPEYLRSSHPDHVLIMNSIYRPEIEAMIRAMQINPVAISTMDLPAARSDAAE
jgi:SAM-dependent methyltransferase